jgi:hypothetical protein
MLDTPSFGISKPCFRDHHIESVVIILFGLTRLRFHIFFAFAFIDRSGGDDFDIIVGRVAKRCSEDIAARKLSAS